MSLQPGERLGPYEIVAPLGAGGMGEVYEARDTRLGRAVAIKISQAAFSERFEREARTVSALNHPNICQLYDVGPNYLVMELVDGSPVAAVDTPRRLLGLQWHAAEIGIPDGRVRVLPSSGGWSMTPDWNAGGTRYLFATYRNGRWGVDESSVTDGISRSVTEVAHGSVASPRWAADGNQFSFIWIQQRDERRVMLSNLSGRVSPLDPGAPGNTDNAIWSGDGALRDLCTTGSDRP
jgi:hypothetical protein